MYIDQQNDKFGTPLGFAIGSGSVDMVKFPLRKGTNPEGETCSPQVTCLEHEAHQQTLKVVKVLLEAGTSLYDRGALHGAAEKCSWLPQSPFSIKAWRLTRRLPLRNASPTILS